MCIYNVWWPWATNMCVSPWRKGPEVHFDCVFTVFGGPGLQICVFCLGEKGPEDNFDCVFKVFGGARGDHVCARLTQG